MKQADLKKMGDALDEIRKSHGAILEGVKLIMRQLKLQTEQMQLMELEFHVASQISEPEN